MEPHGYMTDQQFGELVKTARMRRKWSQGELASKMKAMGVEISQAKVSVIERGAQPTNQEMRRALVELLELSPGPPSPPPPPSPSVVRDPPPMPAEAPKGEELTFSSAPPPRVRRPARRPSLPVSVADLPRTTLYLEHSTKRLLDAAARVTGRPAYKLLAEGFLEWLERLPQEEQRLIHSFAERS